MAKILTKNSFTTGVTPSGLSAGELAVNVSDKKIFIGNAVEGVVTLHDQNNVVTSVNGATGAVTNINAASVTVTNSNSSSTVYPLFAFGIGNTAIYADITTTPFSYVPSTGTLNGRIFNGTFGASQVAKLDAQALALTINDGTDLATITNISNAHNGVNSYTVSSNVGLTLYGPSIAFSAPSFYYKFPTSVGSNGQILTTNGLSNATLSWTSTLPEIISFEKGISASNATTSNVIDVVAPNDGCGLRVAQATTGSTSRVGAVRLGRSTTNSSNIYLEGYVGSFRVYNGISGTLSGNAGTKMLDLNTTSADFGVSISGVTFTGLVRSTAGICANAAITGGSYFSSESGYRVGSSTINAKTGTTYSLLSSDDGKIITISNSATHTLTVPSGLPIGFNCTVIQLGTGGVGITSSGTTLNSFNSKYTLAGQHAAVSIISYLTNTFNIAGGLTT